MNDIVTAVHLASQLLQDGSQGGGVRDKDLQNDILGIHHALNQLSQSLLEAQRRYLNRSQANDAQVYEPLSPDLENERRSFVGDIAATLRACEELLAENNQIRLRYGLDPATLQWHLARQDTRADDLRLRLYLHDRKIQIVLKCLSRGVPTRSNKIGRSSNTTAHVAGARLSDRFQRSLYADKSSAAGSSIAIDRGFDAVLISFEQSTTGEDDTPDTYLAFLKARWLLERIRLSPEYRTAHPGVYFHHAAAQIMQTLDRHASLPYSEQVLMKLPESSFQIWQPSTNPLPSRISASMDPHPLTTRPTEVKLICVPLLSTSSTQLDSLTVFQSSDERYRLVRETYVVGQPGNVMVTTQTVYTREDRLVPRYTNPNLIEAPLEIAIHSRQEETLFTFASPRDLYDFQATLTGHDVSHGQQGIRCQFSDEASSLDCAGRIQLWQEPVPMKSEEDDSRSIGSNTIRGERSVSGSTSSLLSSVAPTVATKHTVYQTDGGWEAEGVKVASLVIFTELADRKKRRHFAIISVEIGIGVSVDPKQCRCCRDYNACSKLVLTRERKGKLAVRVLYSDLDASGQPNSNTFDLLPFRIPRHPGSNSLTVKQTEYLVLKFPTLEEKRQFHDELGLRFEVRDVQLKNQQDFAKNIRRMEAQPKLRQESLGSSRKHSFAPSIVSLPPRIGTLDNGPAFADAMNNLRLAEPNPPAELPSMRSDIVEAPGDTQLVELATDTDAPGMDIAKDKKSFDAFLELPGSVPWFPAN